MTDFQTLAQAARALAKREISAVELLEEKLAICKRAEPLLYSFITLDERYARAMAMEADARLAASSDITSLTGIPIAMKDVIDVAGLRGTGHSNLYASRVATKDAFAVSRLRESGAVIMGKLATNEFAIGLHDDATAVAPQPRNPWNTAHSPGGSSSGSATAVAAGEVAGALGSDTGGSIRVPCAFNGISGLKPSRGLVSRVGAMPLSETMDNVGPMARTVEDVAILLDGIAYPDPEDPVATARSTPSYAMASATCPRGLRFTRIRMFDKLLSQAQHQALDNTEKALIAMGAVYVDVALPSLEELDAVGTLMATCESYHYHRERLAAHPELYGRDARVKLHIGALISGDDYLLASQLKNTLGRRFAAAMEEVDIVLTPPARGAAPVYEAPSTPSFATWAHAGFNMQANVLGLPALTFMAGQDGGLPVAAQLWASCGNDHIVLAAGRAVEKVLNDKGMRPTEWPAF